MNTIRVLDHVELIPVLEINPHRFASPELLAEYHWPHRTDEQREAFWARAVAEVGLGGIQPIERGLWFVRTTELQTVPMVQRMLAAQYCDSGGPAELLDEDRRCPLSGGLVFRGGDYDVQILPTCCSDLGNRRSWSDAVKFRQSGWQMLWIGHPWLMTKYESPWLYLSDYTETEEPVARWAIDPEELQRALGEVDTELLRFADLVREALPPSDPDVDRDEVARLLVGLPT